MVRLRWEPGWWECNWCQGKGAWRGRPCLRESGIYHRNESIRDIRRAKREECDRVRSENAAKRWKKTMPRVYRRAARFEAARAHGKAAETEEEGHGDYRDNGACQEPPRSVTPAVDTSASLEVSTTVEDVSKADTRTDTATEKRDYGNDPRLNKKEQRQRKAFAGPKTLINEGINLAFDDDQDVETIHRANRKAWPRGESQIRTDATREDRELAELVRIGLLAPEDLVVDHWEEDGDICPYTIRFVDAKRKGLGPRARRLPCSGSQGPELAIASEEGLDWSCIGDEAFAQLVQDGWFDLMDGSEASYVFVDE